MDSSGRTATLNVTQNGVWSQASHYLQELQTENVCLLNEWGRKNKLALTFFCTKSASGGSQDCAERRLDPKFTPDI